MFNTIIIRNGEVAIKGENRPVFEKKLMTNIKKALYGMQIQGYKVYKGEGRIYIDADPEIMDQVIEKVRNVFGVVTLSPAIKAEKGYEKLKEMCLEVFEDAIANGEYKTFKMDVKRQNKSFHMTSPEMTKDIAGYILSKHGDKIGVDVFKPELTVYAEFRDNLNIVYARKIDGAGGMPVGINGKVATLLSGGIDSPVATYLASKRGLEIEAVHFHSFPFTSEKSMQKVEQLAKIVSLYTGSIKIHMVNLLPVQKEIAEKCPEELMTILSRRFMMRIAERIANQTGCGALVTGESIGQVASQTIEGLTATNDVVRTMPVIRPLISFDKEDIIKIARNIETFETSIIPEEDCCTVFLPKRPATKPKLEKIYKAEEALDIEKLVSEAIENSTVVDV
ncbi:MAG: tRNA 4-thiouridine(8) synthase ThiI [Proteocatella sp.]|nr:tRNA 4-thiouridine(8) synthase ThiI [Proteocatella sp.]MBP7907577.1 tRNA 4-thiouridine(8) synthase ThiI [Proteocatella sp.]MBP7913114.1 tRNA 4-thiouridine(8) synthase ThiI [Proteocatella sp.]MBP8653707.1 tRNA 4-thiouridine(8) synthase ThiI [Proteocatella sp.]MBP9658382.1 tRNA 4-thiouridine(8) synthase ThiI [Proteocatella sp.]